MGIKDDERGLKSKDVEDDFVVIQRGGKARKSLARQIDENVMGIKQEDYDKDGQLDLQCFQKRKSEKK